jgi:hypothetical protein
VLDLTLAALVAFARGSLSPDPDPAWSGALVEPAPEPDRRDPCGGWEGWVGDGDDGRDPPACDDRGPEAEAEREGLHAPDWLRREEDGEDPGDPD